MHVKTYKDDLRSKQRVSLNTKL